MRESHKRALRMGDLESPSARDRRLLDMLHTPTEELVRILGRGGGTNQATSMQDERGVTSGKATSMRRARSAPMLSLSATPPFVQRVLIELELEASAAPAKSTRPRRAPVPAPSAGRPPPGWRRPPPFHPPPQCSFYRRRDSSHPQLASTHPAPLDRFYSRGVQRRLDQIQGSRTPLRDRLPSSPGYRSLPVGQQQQLRHLVSSDPSAFNMPNAPALHGQSIRQVIAALQLRSESDLRLEMQVYDRQLQMEQLRSKLRGGAPRGSLH